MSERSGRTWADQPGRITMVVSRSSTTAGPAMRAPGFSAGRWYTGVSCGGSARPNRTCRLAAARPRPFAGASQPASIIDSAGSAPNAETRHVTTSTGRPGILIP
jgi:hypothetical protein